MPRLRLGACRSVFDDVVGVRLVHAHNIFLNFFQLFGSINGSPQSQLELGFGGSIQLFVDGWVVAIEGDVDSGRVGEAVKPNLMLQRNGKQKTKLYERSQLDVGQALELSPG